MWPCERSFAADAKSAAVSRLSRASRHRAQNADRRAAAPGPQPGAVTPTDAVVPSETQASDVQVEQVLAHPALVVTRPIEWGTVVFGFEQANRYQVMDEQGNVVALIAEDRNGIGNEVGRQLLRTRRSFTATVLSADGSQVIFRVRRPMYLVTSNMIIEDGAGNQIGEVIRRWSAINRNYDLYLRKQQFAKITGTFLAWEFELRDGEDRTLAFIDRNFQGFGKEIFTDAGQYAIHFGLQADEAKKMAANTAQAKANQAGGSPASSPMPLSRGTADMSDGKALIPTASGNMIEVARPLAIDERMITLACAISIDYDFFSQHSHGSGVMPGMVPIMPMPMPYPGGAEGGTSSGGDVGAAGGAPGPADPGMAAPGVAPPPPDANLPPQGDGDGDGTGGDSGWGWGNEGGAGGSQGSGWGGNDQEITWDNGSGGDDGESAGAAGSIVGTLWEWVSGGD